MVGVNAAYKEYITDNLKNIHYYFHNEGFESSQISWLNRFCYYCYLAHLKTEGICKTEVDKILEEIIMSFHIKNSLNKISPNIQHYLLLLNRFSYELNNSLVNNTQHPLELITEFNMFTQKLIEISFHQLFELSEDQLMAHNLASQATTPYNEQKNITNFYRNLLHNIPIPILILDNNLCIADLNNLANDMFSSISIGSKFLSPSAIGNNTNRILLHHIANLSKQKSDQIKFETYLDSSLGNRFYRVSIKKLIFKEQHFNGLMIMFNDLSNRKKIELHLEDARQKAEESDNLKTSFLANMSHEIRTPMNAIVGFSELLVTTNPSKDEMNEYLGLIRKSGKDLLNIIEDIIDIAKIEAKQLKIKKKPTKPSELFHDLYKVYQEQLVRCGIDQIELRLNTNNTDKNIQFHTDTERLKQVIANLLNNAIKFTDKGFIEFGYKLEGKNSILFYVKDSGIGIPQNMQSRIFERFVQVEDSIERNNGGTGLGLTISMNIIKLLGGLIQIQSEPGKGSNFYFQLPLEKVEQNERVIPVKITKNSLKIPDLTNNTILIAEDEPSNYYYLHEILKATNANLIWAKNGLEAINLAEQDSSIELILMDIKMPEINGLEAAKYISNIRPHLPIIAQTANAMDNDMATCLKAGCVDYISKPINRTKLFCLIQRHLKKITQATKV